MAWMIRWLLVLVVATGFAGCQEDEVEEAVPPASDGAAGGASLSLGDVEGDAVRGGKLYDKWWAVTMDAEPTTDHPLWASRPDTTSNTNAGSATWRCKECHGWDYKGVAGAYATGGHATGIGGVLDTALSSGDIAAALKDPAKHAYGDVLDEQDLADLGVFVAMMTVDVGDYIGADGSFSGDADAGSMVFSTVCSVCHGAEGLNTVVVGAAEGFEDFPGLVASENPQEFLHKIRFGQPGTAMPALAVTMPDALADIGAYAQTLPHAP